MKTITGTIKAEKFTEKACSKKCLFYNKNTPVTPCSTEVIPFLTKYLNLPNCADGFVYVEEK